jgi:hypothetical protein
MTKRYIKRNYFICDKHRYQKEDYNKFGQCFFTKTWSAIYKTFYNDSTIILKAVMF